jgi:predicted metal-dependent hydrolase
MVGDIQVELVRKDVKNLRLGVYPPHGAVRLSAPLAVSEAALQSLLIEKLGWIRRHRARFAGQPLQARQEIVTGESHYVFGRPYQLRVHEQPGSPRVVVSGTDTLDLMIPSGTRMAQRETLLWSWYRAQLRELIPSLLDTWQPALGVQVAEWSIKRMKTRWGSCNIPARRVWFNLELAKKPVQCLEYVVVHELAHLLERRHNARFKALMDLHLPQWRQRRELLNSSQLSDSAGHAAAESDALPQPT